MQQPIIFLSYSATEDSKAYAYVKAIQKTLEASGFEVFLDRASVAPGDDWLEKIHCALEGCHGAVIVLTPEALISPWVVKEVSVLTFRKWEQAELPIVTVLLGEVKPEEVEKTFKAQGLAKYQAVTVGTDDLANSRVAERLTGAFEGWKAKAEAAPLRPFEQEVTTLLDRARELHPAIAQELGIDARSAAPALARAMMRAKPVQIGRCLCRLRNLEPEKTDELYERLCSFWVRPQAAQLLTELAVAEEPKCPVAVNARSEKTGRFYVKRASTLRTLRTLNTLRFTADTTTDPASAALRLAEEQAQREADALQRTLPAELPADTVTLCRTVLSAKAYFILIDGAHSPRICDDIRRRFQEHPYCRMYRLFFLTGPGDFRPPGTQFLDPALAEGDEFKFHAEFAAGKKLLEESS